MKVINGKWPPNINEIRSHFNISGLDYIVYTYGQKIFVPSGNKMPDELIKHETTHGEQQKKMGPKKWWDKYLADPEFRLEQELEAYRAQWRFLATASRQYRKFVLRRISKDLSGRMYGNMLTREEAQKLITEEK